jgi:hypothetical protein
MVLKPMARFAFARRHNQPSDHRVHTRELLPMFFLLTFDVFDLASQVFMRCQHLPQSDERPNDQHIHLNGAFAFKHRAQHHHAVLGKRIRQMSPPAAAATL